MLLYHSKKMGELNHKQVSTQLHDINLRECRSVVLCAGVPHEQVRHIEVPALPNDVSVVSRAAQMKLQEQIMLAVDPECTHNRSFILKKYIWKTCFLTAWNQYGIEQ